MPFKKIRVLVVDDSLFARTLIVNEITKDAAIEVVGTASDPYEAREKVLSLDPDVMTLDVQMPGMNGIEFLKQLMPQHPLPVLVVSSVSGVVFDALQAGAVDFVTKPAESGEAGRAAFVSELIVKLKIASIAKVGQHKNSPQRQEPGAPTLRDTQGHVIALGASTGGTEATAQILSALRDDLPGIVIVQHMPPVFTRLYAERLNNTTRLAVKEAGDGDVLRPGTALVAPGDFHMTVEKYAGGYRVRCQKGEKVSGHCPSVDVLFESVAKAAGKKAMGILLTGMGGDGANGLLQMKKGGAHTVGQNKATCVVYGMPAVAMSLGAVDKELPLNAIAHDVYAWRDEKMK
ncbi:MAG: chemotaxis response regulator protein-glutamate methylesterase [Clostridiaceae bacterium]|nr:chemotaxis response regulator protein-glutamate methylesterase [Eubacteriales bacterium]